MNQQPVDTSLISNRKAIFGDRTMIYFDPTTRKREEGVARIVRMKDTADPMMTTVLVEFDEGITSGLVKRKLYRGGRFW